MRFHRPPASMAALALPTVLLAAACTGATSSTAPSAAANASPAAAASTGTDLVGDFEIGGRTLHLVCVGPPADGRPTVILEGGLEAPYPSWSEITTGMQATHRVCAYDRAGLGASPPAPGATRTTKDQVADLHALLTTAGVGGPLVLVGHSSGAWNATLYTSTYPDDVAGVVFVDPRAPQTSDGWRAALPAPAASEDPAIAANRDELKTFESDASKNAEHLLLGESAEQASAVLDADGPLFGDRPVIVLGAANTHVAWSNLPPALAKTFGAIWLDGQKALAAESTAGSFVEVPDSGHEIQLEQPAAVIDAIESVLAELAN